jgi:transposase
MGKSRRNYSREFKLEAVKQVIQHNRTVTEVAHSLGLNRNLLTRWKTELESAGTVAFPGNGKPAAGDEEIRRLRQALATAEQERDILKKAVAFFAKAKN